MSRALSKSRAELHRLLALVLVVSGLAVAPRVRSAAPLAPAPSVRTNGLRFLELAPFATPYPDDAPALALPRGLQTLGGVPFRVQERVAVTGLEAARNGDLFPAQITGLPVGAKVRRVFLLHGANFADKDGTPMAKLVFHHANGVERSVRLVYGVHARNWLKARSEKKSELADPNSELAWSGAGEGTGRGEIVQRLYRTAFENPLPDEIITQIDLVSLFSRATPFLAAVTLETDGSDLPPNRALPARKIFRDAQRLDDPAYRGELVIRAVDDGDGRALTNARASLTITDDHGSYYFGEARADATGVCRLPYPPMQTVGFNLLVRAPGRIPVTLGESRPNRSGFSTEFAAKLARGVTVGGLVKDPSGQPVAGAEIVIHKVTKVSTKEYTRVDYDTVTTDAAGHWSSTSVPAGFDGFGFELKHPDYRPAIYAMPGLVETNTNNTAAPRAPTKESVVRERRILTPATEVGADRARPARPANPRPVAATVIPTVTSNALLTASAEMILQPGILVSGTLVDGKGKPIPRADVILQTGEAPPARRHLLTDDRGAFRTVATEPGDAALVVVLKGYTPKFQPLTIAPGLAPVELRLAGAREFKGTVLEMRTQKPVPGARVRVTEWQGASDLLRFQAVTDADGNFTWNGAPVDNVMFTLSRSNYYNMSHSASGLGDSLTMQLQRQPGIAGRVYDVDTKKPIDLFTVIKGRKYNQGEEQIHWERHNTERGRNGEYFARVDDYYFQPEARIMIEAPGYIPQISPGFTQAGAYTNDFALKKGRGLSGVVRQSDGTPLANATVVLVDTGENAYMGTTGQFQSGSGNGDLTRTDAQGRFEFSPKLQPDMILVAHDYGFAEVRAQRVATNGLIVAQPWGRIKGRLAVGDRLEPDQSVRLESFLPSSSESGERPTALSLYIKADLDAAGNFVYEKVPPGERRVQLVYKLHEDREYETPLSHGQFVLVPPGETAAVTLGGTGRKLVGRVKVTGGSNADVDWRRDVHRLTLRQTIEGMPQLNLANITKPAEQQKILTDYNRRQQEFYRSEKYLGQQRSARTYVCLFSTNGAFRIDNVPPGTYDLNINPSDPDEEYYRRRPIGQFQKEVVVPDQPGAKVNQPFDLGELTMAIRPKTRLGQVVPSFTLPTLDGQTVKLEDFRGKHVLLYFWVSSSWNSFDTQQLKELNNTFAKQGKLAILGMNLDQQKEDAVRGAKMQGYDFPHALLGPWGQSPIPNSLGLEGYPCAVLIDANGRLASRALYSSSIRVTVRNAMANVAEPGAPVVR